MAKNACYICLISFLSFCYTGCLPKDEITVDTDTAVPSKPALVVESHRSFEEICNDVKQVYTSQAGIHELTGHNDGPGPKRWLAAVGLKEGNPYCAAGVVWTFQLCGVKTTITGYSPTSVNYKNLVYSNRNIIKEPHTADVVSFYFPNLKRIGHTGFLDHMTSEDMCVTFEFNTSNSGAGINRDGGGAYFKKRSLNMITYISRWIPEK